ncbi:glycosyl transferase family 1 [Kocuria flava]|uniref:D-inositol 3-phosphate glycosyltransferase n=1 Tax=Kocuria flava TaxID=446860 RepID=A0A2N4T4G3_9MICC|nr:glycosyltransferase [Kocuria flava]PLC13118.1 glycosyl transferase family 1 [Kocuria flava]
MSAETTTPDRPLTVLLGAETYPPDVNGAAQFAHRLARGLHEQGHRVHVACMRPEPGPSQRREDDGVVEHRLRSHHAFTHPYFRLCLPWEVLGPIRRLLDEVRPDVVHVQCHYILGRLLVREARRRGIRTVGTNHFMPENLEPFLPFPGWFLRWYRGVSWRDMVRVLGRCDVVTAPTPLAVATMRENGFPDSVLAVSNGIRIGDYEPRPGERAGAPARPTVLFVGRLAVEKNVDVLVEAVARLRREHGLDVRAELAGDGEQRARLQELARRRGVADRVVFLGHVSDEQLREAYLRADVFCQPGTAELQSLVTLEAMSAARPVVLADARALPHLVDEGVNGWLFAPGDPADLAEKLARVLGAPPQERARMGRASRRKVERHSFPRTLETFVRLYRGQPVEQAPGPHAHDGGDRPRRALRLRGPRPVRASRVR